MAADGLQCLLAALAMGHLGILERKELNLESFVHALVTMGALLVAASQKFCAGGEATAACTNKSKQHCKKASKAANGQYAPSLAWPTSRVSF